MKPIYINCDLGEGIGNDAELMPLIDACSIACGGHIGDEASMTATVDLALAHEVKIGAHPSYPDKINFGRKPMSIGREELIESLIGQISSLAEICSLKRLKLDHVKPHGALYNKAMVDAESSEIILEVMSRFERVSLFVPWGSVISKLAIERGIPIVLEAFADRRYTSAGTLAGRQQTNALITDPKAALEQINSIINLQKVTTITEENVHIEAETFCLHGDNPHALSILNHIRNA